MLQVSFRASVLYIWHAKTLTISEESKQTNATFQADVLKKCIVDWWKQIRLHNKANVKKCFCYEVTNLP